jgi:hypothetical protein
VRGPLEGVAGIVPRDILGRGLKHSRRHKLISCQSIVVQGSENRAEPGIHNDPTPFHEHLCIHVLGALVRVQQQYSASRQSPTNGQIDERVRGCAADAQQRIVVQRVRRIPILRRADQT